MTKLSLCVLMTSLALAGLGCAAPDDDQETQAAAQTANLAIDSVVIVPREFSVEGSLIVGVSSPTAATLEMRAADRKVIRSVPVTLRLVSVGVQAGITGGSSVGTIHVENWEGRRVSELLGGYYGFGGGVTVIGGGTKRSTFSSGSGVTLGGYGMNSLCAGLGIGIAGYRLSVTADGDYEDVPLEKGGTSSRPTYDLTITDVKIEENDESRQTDPFGGLPDPVLTVSAIAHDLSIWSNSTKPANDTFTPRFEGVILSRLTEDALDNVVLQLSDADVLINDAMGDACNTKLEIGSGTIKCTGSIPFAVSYTVKRR